MRRSRGGVCEAGRGRPFRPCDRSLPRFRRMCRAVRASGSSRAAPWDSTWLARSGTNSDETHPHTRRPRQPSNHRARLHSSFLSPSSGSGLPILCSGRLSTISPDFSQLAHGFIGHANPRLFGHGVRKPLERPQRIRLAQAPRSAANGSQQLFFIRLRDFGGAPGMGRSSSPSIPSARYRLSQVRTVWSSSRTMAAMAGAVKRCSPAKRTMCARVRSRTSLVVRYRWSKTSNSSGVGTGISTGFLIASSFPTSLPSSRKLCAIVLSYQALWLAWQHGPRLCGGPGTPGRGIFPSNHVGHGQLTELPGHKQPAPHS